MSISINNISNIDNQITEAEQRVEKIEGVMGDSYIEPLLIFYKNIPAKSYYQELNMWGGYYQAYTEHPIDVFVKIPLENLTEEQQRTGVFSNVCLWTEKRTLGPQGFVSGTYEHHEGPITISKETLDQGIRNLWKNRMILVARSYWEAHECVMILHGKIEALEALRDK
jgi:hypothetical protein